MNIMFQTRFEPLIVSGQKVHTIRPKRKKPLRFGMPLSLRIWTGKPYRSPQREILAAKVYNVLPICISVNQIVLNGFTLSPSDSDMLARQDGFITAGDLIGWFIENHQLPFEGEIIYWKPNGPTTLPT